MTGAGIEGGDNHAGIRRCGRINPKSFLLCLLGNPCIEIRVVGCSKYEHDPLEVGRTVLSLFALNGLQELEAFCDLGSHDGNARAARTKPFHLSGRDGAASDHEHFRAAEVKK